MEDCREPVAPRRGRMSRRRGLASVLPDADDFVARLGADAPLVVWRYAPARRAFLHLSAYAEVLFGYPLASWREGGVLAARMRPGEGAILEAALADTLVSGAVGEFACRLRAADGRELSLRCIAVPLAAAPDELSGLFVDLSLHVALTDALAESEARFRQAFEQIPSISVQGYDRDRRVAFWNPASERMYGYTAHEAIGRQLEDLIIPETMREQVRRAIVEWVDHGVPIPARELALRRKDGSVVPVFSSHVMIRNPAGGAELYCMDIELTEMKAAERQARESEARFRRTFEEAPIGICVSAPDGRLLEVNPAFCRLCGYPAEALRKLGFEQITHPDDRPGDRALLAECLEGGLTGFVIEKRLLRSDGQPVWVELTTSLLSDEGGRAVQFISIVEDVTQRRASREQVAYTAHHDALTGLPNRALLVDRLNMALAQAVRGERCVALLSIDVDRFKAINESVGYLHGDGLLQAMAARLRAHARQADTVCRPGGDEFYVLLSEIGSAERALQVADKLVRLLARPYEVAGRVLECTVSIGVAVFPEHGDDAARLLHHADMALHGAKDGGRNTARLVDLSRRL